jgi:hypothetical protein
MPEEQSDAGMAMLQTMFANNPVIGETLAGLAGRIDKPQYIQQIFNIVRAHGKGRAVQLANNIMEKLRAQGGNDNILQFLSDELVQMGDQEEFRRLYNAAGQLPLDERHKHIRWLFQRSHSN